MKSYRSTVIRITVFSLVLTFGLFAFLMAPGFAESRIVSVTAGDDQRSAAVNGDGTVWVWGSGVMESIAGLTPAIHPGLSGVKAVSEGTNGYDYALKNDGTVWAMDFQWIHLGSSNGSPGYELKAHRLDGFENIVAISSRGANLIALRNDGTVWMTGNNCYGQLGTDFNYGDLNSGVTTPIQVKGLANVTAVSMGDKYAVALKSDGTVWTWGLDSEGQLGDGQPIGHEPEKNNPGVYGPEGKTTPTMVKGLTNATAIAAGDAFTLALKDDGTVWSWGKNYWGELGDGLPNTCQEYSTIPVQVKDLTNVASISAGSGFGLALRDDGTVWTLGNNSVVPVMISDLSGIVGISAGWDHCLALDENGMAWAWGRDDCGQLGDGAHGPDEYRKTPFQVPFSIPPAGAAIKPGWMVPPRPINPASHEARQNDTIVYMAAGSDGTLYSFTINGLTAFDSNGNVKWNMTIPGRWVYGPGYKTLASANSSGASGNAPGISVQMFASEKSLPVFTTGGGNVYLYAIANASDRNAFQNAGPSYADKPPYEIPKELIAVSPDGTVMWNRTFVNNISVQDTSHVEAHDGRIYLFHDYNETVFDAAGNTLFDIGGVAGPVAVDESGDTYAMRAGGQDWFSSPATQLDIRMPSNVLEKYGPDGKLVWGKELGENASTPYISPGVRNQYGSLPLYSNGRLYVPVDDGVIALDKNGMPLWTKKFDDDGYKPFSLMPIDDKGNLYFAKQNPDTSVTIRVVKLDGSDMGPAATYPRAVIASNGVLYSALPVNRGSGLETAIVSAYDIKNNVRLWNFSALAGEIRTVTVNESNVNDLFPEYYDDGLPAGTVLLNSSLVSVIPTGTVTYVYVKTSSHEEPVVLNGSSYTYSSTLYALDDKGNMVWQKPTGWFVTSMAADNTTIYYSTGDGKISSAAVTIAAGLAIAAAALLFMKFFVIGSVSRARSMIDKNDNRNRILKVIMDRPGSSLYEISRELGLNIGTIRYHLMILGINHRIVSYNDDGKYVRYFTNSNTYSREDQMVISLARRDSMGKILKVLVGKAGVTNIDVCAGIDMPQSTVSKCLSELHVKGILVKTPTVGSRATYSIKKEHLTRITNALRLVDGGIPALQCERTALRAET